MRLHFIMCLSCSVICLLLFATTHSSVITAEDSEVRHRENDGASRFHNRSHISSRNLTKDDPHQRKTSAGLQSQLSTSVEELPPKDLNFHADAIQHGASPGINRIRKARSTGDDVLPKHIAHSQRRNSHSDHGHPPVQLAALSSEKLTAQTSSHSRFYHHHNGTEDDHSHDVPASEHEDHRHSHDLSAGDAHDHIDNGHPDSAVDEGSDHGEVVEPSSEEKAAQPTSNNEEEQLKNIVACGDKEHATKHEDSSGEFHDDHEFEHGHEHKSTKVKAEYHQHYTPNTRNISGKEWLYASLAVVIISLCGLFSVAVIPIMQKWFYHTLLQFLVGLAVGSLSGDGLLHLMPHAILDGEGSHDHGKDGELHHTDGPLLQSMEKTAIWRGLAALGGIFFFFIAERLLGILTTYRRQRKEARLSSHPKNMVPVVSRDDGTNNGSVGEKLAQPKKNSYDHIKEKDEKETIQMLQAEGTPTKKGSNQSVHEVGFHGRSSFSLEPDVSVAYRPDSESSVIVSEHHGHAHGHSHEIPQSVSAVAWMVIMGDGLHNFCDGLAIGAAFASGDADGISTTVAVFCHELPHELGDFAMLLKTGMKVKQALFYNALSSVLCFVGMVIGVSLGNVQSATNWVFAGTAGMFLYIALVDMLPELTSTNDGGPTAVSTLFVQVLGISIGICIMLLIALYEHELHSIVS